MARFVKVFCDPFHVQARDLKLSFLPLPLFWGEGLQYTAPFSCLTENPFIEKLVSVVRS
jgi:hypothetical protein